MFPLTEELIVFICILFIADNVEQISSVPVYVQVLDINDHAPELSDNYKTYVCENAGSGQVRLPLTPPYQSHAFMLCVLYKLNFFWKMVTCHTLTVFLFNVFI